MQHLFKVNFFVSNHILSMTLIRFTWVFEPVGKGLFYVVFQLVLLMSLQTAAHSQSFFGSVLTDPTVGVDRGSASQIRKVGKATRFLTFDTYGSKELGPGTLGLGAALPNLATQGDQLDMTVVVAGPSTAGASELLAGGIAYRLPVNDRGTLLYASVDYADAKLGTAQSLAFGITGHRKVFALGVSHTWTLKQAATLAFVAEMSGRDVKGHGFGMPTADESLRFVRVSMLYQQGIPLLFQRRFSVSLTKGFDQIGASATNNPLSSTPGASSDFLRAAFSAETSVPVSQDFVVNAGVIGQWSADTLPLSQRCGYGTNAYSRGFDRSFVTGDRCLGARVELAYNIEVPKFGAKTVENGMRFTQSYLGVDFGVVENVSNHLAPGTSEGWSSVSMGIRTLRGNFIGELSVTTILDKPSGLVAQDDTRLWLRTAITF